MLAVSLQLKSLLVLGGMTYVCSDEHHKSKILLMLMKKKSWLVTRILL